MKSSTIIVLALLAVGLLAINAAVLVSAQNSVERRGMMQSNGYHEMGQDCTNFVDSDGDGICDYHESGGQNGNGMHGGEMHGNHMGQHSGVCSGTNATQ